MSVLQVTGAAVVNGGSGGTNGTRTVTVLGGMLSAGGSPAQLSVTVSGGAITAVLSVVNPGNYILFPMNPVQVSGASLVGATLGLQANYASTLDDFPM